MDRLSRLSTEQRSNLVAYLDGELDDPAAQEIEQVLASNEIARHEVDMLVRTWQLLDELPKARVSEEFTRNTLTRIQVPPVVDTSPQLLRHGAWTPAARKALLGLLAAAALFGGAALGFVATSRWMPDESQLLIEELPLIENLELYNDVRSVEFLQELDRSALMREDRHAPRP